MVNIPENGIKNSIAVHKAEADSILKMVEVFEVNNKDDYSSLGDILVDIKTQFKAIEKERKTVTEPLNAIIKKVNGWFKPASKDFEKIEKTIKRKMADYQLSQKQRQNEALAQAVEQEDPRFLQKATSLQMEKVQGISSRVIWRFEIVNTDLLPDHLCKRVPDNEAIDKIVQEKRDDTAIPGVRVIKDVQISARAG